MLLQKKYLRTLDELKAEAYLMGILVTTDLSGGVFFMRVCRCQVDSQGFGSNLGSTPLTSVSKPSVGKAEPGIFSRNFRISDTPIDTKLPSVDDLIAAIVGPPACGKTTLGRALEEAKSIRTADTGNLLDVGTSGAEAEAIQQTKAAGAMVSSDTVLPLVLQHLSGSGMASISGCPRGEDQAQRMLDYARGSNRYLLVLNIVLPESECYRRLTERLACTQCTYTASTNGNSFDGQPCPKCGAPLTKRKDDSSEEAVKERMARYKSYGPQTIRALTSEFSLQGGGSILNVSGQQSTADQVALVWKHIQALRERQRSRS